MKVVEGSWNMGEQPVWRACGGYSQSSFMGLEEEVQDSR